MTKWEQVLALRADTTVHYNCAQSVLIPYARECGLSEETACNLGSHFGGGMRMGSVCGAATGALMVLGAMGYSEEESNRLLRKFREKNGSVNCAELLRGAHERGEERKAHCDRMIEECIAFLEETIGR